MIKNGPFWRVFEIIEQKMVENAKIKKMRHFEEFSINVVKVSYPKDAVFLRQ